MRTGWRYGLYGLCFLAAALAGTWLTVHLVVRGGPEVDVPELTGRDVVTALKAAGEKDLYLSLRGQDFDETVPKDHIIHQDPAPGTRLKKNREVKVIVSKGSAAIPLPELVGLPLEQAASLLRLGKLKTGRVIQVHDMAGPTSSGRVLAQAPEPLTLVKPGFPVDLLVSLGPRPKYRVMPDLTGQPYSLALMALETYGLQLGRVTEEERTSWPPGGVLLQDPAPGRRVAPGQGVQLTVNRETLAQELVFHLVEYDVPYGFYPHQIQFRMVLGARALDLSDQWHPPGEKVRLAAALPGDPWGRVLDDGQEALRWGPPLPEPPFPILSGEEE